ncbi:pyridine nucleotide-disulfide oxidoreductase [Tumebacillus permanentifrigoris]|uniref:Pyridine nucleotide-disulfide oxidoreductase n=2 Tax=Tumebacillus permanentifrigoris TaxID=378543 RepID=A0A316D5F3_9BACL|nr:pyridine nucleotide-disulfide oxidoreductase [Tumebacillus permanentifrigoris]
MFLADKDVNTLVIGDGRSMMKSAWVGNYLGIRESFLGANLLETALKQVQEDRGVTVLNETVTAIVYAEDEIRVTTEQGTYLSSQLILANGQGPVFGTAELAGVEVIENDEPYVKQKIKIDDRCRTTRRNVYATGIAVGVASQAIVAAGHGAQTALNLISDRVGNRVHVHQSPKKD